MYYQEWSSVLSDSLLQLWSAFVGYLPLILGAIIIFIIGWIIAVVLGRLVEKLVQSIKLDVVLAKLGFDKVMARANMRLDSGKFLGELVKWFLILVFLMASTSILGWTDVSAFLRSVLFYVPNVIVAVIIMLAAVIIASFLQKLVRASVEAAGLKSANFLALLTKWSVLIFAFMAVLEQLKVAPGLVQTFFTGLMYTLALGIGLAFGLGGKEAAAEFIQKVRHEISER